MTHAARESILRELAEKQGTPFYAYFLEDVRERFVALQNAFEGHFLLSYAVKANPAPKLLQALHGVADMLDISSGGELVRALDAGWTGSSLSFTGPGKTRAELALAVTHLGNLGGEVVLESVEEAELLAELARAANKRVQVLVRIAPARVPPGFGDSMAGKPVAFGIDEEDLPQALKAILAHQDVLDLVGFHAYSGTQCLRASSVVENYQIFCELFIRAAEMSSRTPQKLIFGSGLGIVYHDNQSPLDLAAVGQATVPLLADLAQRFPGVQLVLETGRYVVGEAGVLVTRVLRVKDSRGTRIGICDAGMNHHLAAAGMFGMAIRRNYRMHNLSFEGPNEGSYQLSGPLCTSLDVLARGVALSRLERGDLIVVETSGAYGPTASPGQFISHTQVSEWLVDGPETRPAG